jgi:hypothetical protein
MATSLSEASELFLERERDRYASGDITKSTLNGLQNFTQNWILSRFDGDRPVDDISENEIDQFFDQKSQDYSDSTVRQARSVFSKIQEYPTDAQLAEELSRSRQEFQSALNRLDRISTLLEQNSSS